MVVPDLEAMAKTYVSNLGQEKASFDFMRSALLGKGPSQTFLRRLGKSFGNSSHLWMWDSASMVFELEKVGFKNIRVAKFNDSDDEMFKLVEEESRFYDGFCIECEK